MAQTVLYRKWRPQNFATIVGQKAIVSTLRNALREQRTAHAYLFSGPRGTGKTSTARIFAKAINCMNSQNSEPCNACSSCINITNGSELDYIEIDAASQTGVENIRDLTNNLNFAPIEVRKKVVVIDEVHMLSTSSFNALLKTLEEPPDHVLFILATTEMHKIPATIMSRCQRFEFKRISAEEQVEHLRHICQNEQIELSEDAYHYLARLSDGGMRDALTLLDQTISFAGRKIDVSDLIEVTGGINVDGFGQFLQAARARDVGAVIELAGKWRDQGKNAGQTLQNLIEFFRDLLVCKLLPNSRNTPIKFSTPEWQAIIEPLSTAYMYQAIKALSEFIGEIKYAAHPQIILELALIKLCTDADTSQSAHSTAEWNDLQQKVHQLELQIQHLTKELKQRPQTDYLSAPVAAQVAPVKVGADKLKQFAVAQTGQMTKNYLLDWPKVMAAVKNEKVSLHAWFREGHPTSFLEDAVLVIFSLPIHCETTNRPDNRAFFEKKIAEVYGRAMRLCAIQKSEWQPYADEPSTTPTTSLELQEEPLAPVGQSACVEDALKFFGESLVEIKSEDKGDNKHE